MLPEIKVYLYSDSSLKTIKEIRRFVLSADDYKDYNNFRKLILSLFPSLVKQDFKILWTDNEGENVTISNDNDFGYMKTRAMTCHRIHISPHQEEPKPNIDPVVHPGVICDACDSEIHGHRYKCIQCPDYDLCMQCEIQGMHQEHCLVRLSKPMKLNLDYAKRMAHHFNKFLIPPRHCPVESFGGLRKRHMKHKPSATTETPTAPPPPPLFDIDKTINQTLPQLLKCWGLDMSFLQTPVSSDQEKPGSAEQKNPVPDEQNSSVPADQGKPASAEQEKLVTFEENKPSTSQESPSAPKEDKEKSVSEEEWTILNNILSPSSTQPQVATTPVQGEEPAKTLYPNLPKENQIFHSDPKIQRSVEAMMAMGFNNEGGWLTHLLASKDGDICKALDILQPVRR